MKKITYTSNNSGGDWWLDDEDWYALEKAGWVVRWVATDPYKKEYADIGRREENRWLGALATESISNWFVVRSGNSRMGRDY